MGSSIPSPATWDTSWVGPRQWSCLLVSVCCVGRSLRHLGPHHVEHLGRRRRVRRPQRRARLRARCSSRPTRRSPPTASTTRSPMAPTSPYRTPPHRGVGATRVQLRLRWLRLRRVRRVGWRARRVCARCSRAHGWPGGTAQRVAGARRAGARSGRVSPPGSRSCSPLWSQRTRG